VEEMISLSRLIKSFDTASKEHERKVISLKSLSQASNESVKSTGAEVKDIERMKEQAKRIVADAGMQANNIRQEADQLYEHAEKQIKKEKQIWEQEKLRLIESAKQEGYEQGLKQGQADGLKQYEELIDDGKQLVEMIQKGYEKNISDSESTILLLGIKIAEKILKTEIQSNHNQFFNIVRSAIKEVKEQQHIQIRIHPNLYPFIISKKDELQSIFIDPSTQLFVYPDNDIEDHGCIVESSFGRIDASVDSQLEEIKQKLIELLEGDDHDESS
jgi:flagellar assembly protein FliH